MLSASSGSFNNRYRSALASAPGIPSLDNCLSSNTVALPTMSPASLGPADRWRSDYHARAVAGTPPDCGQRATRRRGLLTPWPAGPGAPGRARCPFAVVLEWRVAAADGLAKADFAEALAPAV